MKLLKAFLLAVSAVLFIAATGVLACAQDVEAQRAGIERASFETRALIDAQSLRAAELKTEYDRVVRAQELIVECRAQCMTDAKKLETLVLAGKSGRRIGYLTFDDGPYTNSTGEFLKVLDAHGVKATFFVMGQWRSRAALAHINAEALAGHTVANHTYTHAIRGGLYSSLESFSQSALSMDRIIYERTGIKPTLLRFPGGSSTCPSALRAQAISWLRQNGYGYVNWNISSGDGGPYMTDPAYEASYVLARTAKRNVSVVLMHDYSDVTLRALPAIITGMREQGYILLPLFYESAMVGK